jgi:hypothetical protein
MLAGGVSFEVPNVGHHDWGQNPVESRQDRSFLGKVEVVGMGEAVCAFGRFSMRSCAYGAAKVSSDPAFVVGGSSSAAHVPRK